jgi:cytochrome b561
MKLTNDSSRYGLIAQLFHWAIVVLIVAQFVLAKKADGLPLGAAKLGTLAQHKSVGITILGLAVLRLSWRLLGSTPQLPAETAAWQRRAAHVSHALLYGLLLVIPVLGWLMSSARNFPVSWFGLVTLPDFIQPNRAAYELLHDAHEFAAKLLATVALVHIAAALKHHFLDRDDVLRRMLPLPSRRSRSASSSPSHLPE